MNRDDFYLLNKDIIYFDNGATTLKPYILSDSISDYYRACYSRNQSSYSGTQYAHIKYKYKYRVSYNIDNIHNK